MGDTIASKRMSGFGRNVVGASWWPRAWRLACAIFLVVMVALKGPVSARAASAYEKVGGCPVTGEGTLGQGAESVAVDYASGDVYVGDKAHDRIARYNAKCEFIEAWGQGVATGAAEYQTCGKVAFEAHEAKYSTCLESGGLGGGEAPGSVSETKGVAVDQETGAVFTLDGARKNGIVQEFSADGERIIASFGKQAPFNTSVEEHPELIHQVTVGGLALGAQGEVYVSDIGGLPGKVVAEAREMVFSPKTSSDEEYVYEGEFGKGYLPEQVHLDSSGDVFVSNEEHVYKFAVGNRVTPACEFHSTGGLLGMTVNPGTGEVFAFTYKKDLFYQLSSSCKVIAEFKGFEHEDSVYGLALNPELAWGPDRPRGVLYLAEFNPTFHENDGVWVFAPPLVGTPPVVEGPKVGPVGESTATLEASVNPEGNEAKYFFEYGPEGSDCDTPGACVKTAEKSLPAGSSAVAVSANVTGLTAGTKYHFRVLVVTHCDASELSFECVPVSGPVYTDFLTSGKTPPVVGGLSVSGVTRSEATLEASIDPEHHETKYYFEYGPEGTDCDMPGACDKTVEEALPAGGATVPVSVVVSGLTPGTKYHFRVVAVSRCNGLEPLEECMVVSGYGPPFEAASAGVKTPSCCGWFECVRCEAGGSHVGSGG